jgi:hypothetical protein
LNGWFSFVSLQNRERAHWVGGWACLLAIALMYAPLAGALLLAGGADCCAGGYCKTPAHHHGKTNQNAPQPAKQAASEPTCDHEHSGLTQCTMSCCQDVTRPALMPVAFVLPAGSAVPRPGETLGVLPLISTTEILRLEQPLSPPPRLTLSVA